jgi:hypothetical protein
LTYVNPKVEKFEEERKKQRDQHILDRTNTLKNTEIPKGLEKLKKLKPLPATIEDGKLLQNFAIQNLDILPENIQILATKAVAN